MNLIWICCFALAFLGCTKGKEEVLLTELKSTAPAKDDAIARAEKEPNFENEINAGFALTQAGDHEKAMIYFERALKRSPDSPVALNNVCSEMNHQKKWKRAAELCGKAVQLAPDFQLARNNLKLAEEQLAQQMLIVEKLNRSVDGAPAKKKVESQIDVGFEYYKMGDYPKAVESWKKIKPLDDKTEVIVLNNLGSAYILMKNFAEARQALNLANQKAPQDILVQNNLKWLEAESKSELVEKSKQ